MLLAAVFMPCQYVMGDLETNLTAYVVLPSDAGDVISLVARSFLTTPGSPGSVQTYSISVNGYKYMRDRRGYIYKVNYTLVQGDNDDSQDKLKVFSKPYQEWPVMPSPNMTQPLYTRLELAYGSDVAVAYWVPNPFWLYRDDPLSGDKAFQHMIYDTAQGNANGAIYLWPGSWYGSSGSVEEVADKGNPGKAFNLTVPSSGGWAGFGYFYDLDNDDSQDSFDTKDMSMFYHGGFLQFDARSASGSTSPQVQVEVKKSDGSVFTEYVSINTTWSTYRIYFTSGTDDPASGVYYFGMTEEDAKDIFGAALFTINWTLVGGTPTSVLIDNVCWRRE